MILKEIASLPPIALALVFYLGSGIAGIVAHYFKKWAAGEIAGSLFCYLFLDYPKKTILTLMMFLASAAGLLALGSITVNTDHLMLIGAGFGIGWSCDSGVNKGLPA